LRIALPKGRLLTGTAEVIRRGGIRIEGYDDHSRSYRFCSPPFQFKVFQERDIPIQVAIGSYDLGICGRQWALELLSRFPKSNLMSLRSLNFGWEEICLATCPGTGILSLEDLKERKIRIATEYPYLAESLALRMRLPEFTISPLWGNALVYPPENAEVALTSISENPCHLFGLFSLARAEAVLIANQKSWQEKDLSPFTSLISPLREEVPPPVPQNRIPDIGEKLPCDAIRFALPDGHQGEPTFELLSRAGIHKGGKLRGSFYFDLTFPALWAKVIRPQDMPLQVAQGNFDLAVTGEDWLWEHKLCFPSSPVRKLLSFPIGRVNICAVTSQDVKADNSASLRKTFPELRVISEYVNIADWYARRNHLSPYRIIPTFGASESFLPEDGDLLIENVQTGATIRKQNLKVIDSLFPSSACLIANEESLNMKGKRISHLVDTLSKASKDYENSQG